jgi:hypothetical protein
LTSLSSIVYGSIYQPYGNSINNINTTNNYQNLYMITLSSNLYGSIYQPYGNRISNLESDTQNQTASTFVTNFKYNLDVGGGINNICV